MEIQHFFQDQALVITPIEKRFDVISSPQLKEKILELIHDSKYHYIILDLSHIQFVDSAGLVCFLTLWKELRKRKRSLKFANLTEPVKQIMELVLLNKVFDIYDNTEKAIYETK